MSSSLALLPAPGWNARCLCLCIAFVTNTRRSEEQTERYLGSEQKITVAVNDNLSISRSLDAAQSNRDLHMQPLYASCQDSFMLTFPPGAFSPPCEASTVDLSSKKPAHSGAATTRIRQRALWCPCGSSGDGGRLIRGLCRRCYARHQHDRAYFAGLRHLVLTRDYRSCQVCHRPEGGQRTLVVHHRKPGISRERLLITLCPGCHARVHKTLVWRNPIQNLQYAVQLWREQHPGGVEQLALDFAAKPPEE